MDPYGLKVRSFCLCRDITLCTVIGLVPTFMVNLLSRASEKNHIITLACRSQWSRGLRCRSAAADLLRLWVRISPRVWMSVCCECCVLSGRGLCDELITRPEEFYRLWCVACDLETS